MNEEILKEIICSGCKQTLRTNMIAIDREIEEWELFIFECMACGTKDEISFNDYYNLKDVDDWYIEDDYFKKILRRKA